jgi:hypothetical protein
MSVATAWDGVPGVRRGGGALADLPERGLDAAGPWIAMPARIPEDSAADRLDGQVVGTDRRAVFQEVLRDGPVGCVGCGYLLVVSGVAVKRANASSKLSWKVLLRAAGCGVRSRWWYQ